MHLEALLRGQNFDLRRTVCALVQPGHLGAELHGPRRQLGSQRLEQRATTHVAHLHMCSVRKLGTKLRAWGGGARRVGGLRLGTSSPGRTLRTRE